MDWKTLAIGALGSLGVALLTGKAARRVLLLPLRMLAKKTATKEDDIIVEEAEKDLGLEHDKREDE